MRPPAVLVSMSIIYTHIMGCMNLMKQVVQEIRSVPNDFRNKLNTVINAEIQATWGTINEPMDNSDFVSGVNVITQRASQEFDDPDWQYIPIDVKGYVTESIHTALMDAYGKYSIEILMGDNKAAKLIYNSAMLAVTADLGKMFNSLTLVPLTVIEDILITEVNAVADALSKLTP